MPSDSSCSISLDTLNAETAALNNQELICPKGTHKLEAFVKIYRRFISSYKNVYSAWPGKERLTAIRVSGLTVPHE
jgi:hypothetical protein